MIPVSDDGGVSKGGAELAESQAATGIAERLACAALVARAAAGVPRS